MADDALEHYENLIQSDVISWACLVHKFKELYASIAKERNVSDKLHDLNILDLKESSDDDSAALSKLIVRINKWAKLAFPKDRDDEAKARFLNNTVAGTTWGMMDQHRLGPNANFQRVIIALQSQLRDMET